jgi:hypothetical protein
VIRYEHPLNERIRTLMRLEDLFQRAQFFLAQPGAPAHHAALTVLFEITDVAARADLKTDLLQELERQKQLLGPLRSNPAIETRVLDTLLSDIDRASAALLAQTGKGRRSSARQRVADDDQAAHCDPGGVCEFDLARLPLLAARRARSASERLEGMDRAVPADLRRPRDHPAAPARQRPGHASDRVSRRLPADADDFEGRAIAAADRSARIFLACRRSARTSTRSTSGSSASPGWTAAPVYDHDVDFELAFCNL